MMDRPLRRGWASMCSVCGRNGGEAMGGACGWLEALVWKRESWSGVIEAGGASGGGVRLRRGNSGAG